MEEKAFYKQVADENCGKLQLFGRVLSIWQNCDKISHALKKAFDNFNADAYTAGVSKKEREIP